MYNCIYMLYILLTFCKIICIFSCIFVGESHVSEMRVCYPE